MKIEIIQHRVGSSLSAETTAGIVVMQKLLIKGDKGDPGTNGVTGASYTEVTATQAIGGQRVIAAVSGGFVYADNTDYSHANAVLGVSVGATTTGQPLLIQSGGIMEDNTWTWTAGNPIFLATNGTMTQTPTTTGFIAVIATALTATKIFIKQPSSIKLI